MGFEGAHLLESPYGTNIASKAFMEPQSSRVPLKGQHPQTFPQCPSTEVANESKLLCRGSLSRTDIPLYSALAYLALVRLRELGFPKYRCRRGQKEELSSQLQISGAVWA